MDSSILRQAGVMDAIIVRQAVVCVAVVEQAVVFAQADVVKGPAVITHIEVERRVTLKRNKDKVGIRKPNTRKPDSSENRTSSCQLSNTVGI